MLFGWWWNSGAGGRTLASPNSQGGEAKFGKRGKSWRTASERADAAANINIPGLFSPRPQHRLFFPR